jgi:TadE-like protein
MKNCAWARGRCEVIAMTYRRTSARRASSGQSMIETVLLMPLLLLVLLNAVNFAYYFLNLVNLTSSQRSGVEYAIMGGATPAATSLPKTGPSTAPLSVSYDTYQDMIGGMYAPTTRGALQVCSPSAGGGVLVNPGTTSERASCDTFGTAPTGFTWTTPHSDPELNAGNTAPAFVLSRLDVAYRFTPLIPGEVFNIALFLAPSCTSVNGNVSCTFHRYAEMRTMN